MRKFKKWLTSLLPALLVLICTSTITGCIQIEYQSDVTGAGISTYVESIEAPNVDSGQDNSDEAVEDISLVDDSSDVATTDPSSDEASTQGSTEIQTTNQAVVETTTEDVVLEDHTVTVSEDGEYSTKDEVALYIHTYGKLPSNYITKKKAEKLGWDNKAGNLWEVAPGKSIGGSYFGNYEGALPEAKGREYRECDIDYDGGGRNAKRIVYSNDGLIYYTDDHYKTFEQLY